MSDLARLLLDRKFLEEVEDLAFEMLADYEDELVKAAIGPDGLVYGDKPLTRRDRILQYLDDQETGLLAELPRDQQERRRREFVRDVEAEGLN